jgi:uncharacterized repeat protein (TIGR01451 family)
MKRSFAVAAAALLAALPPTHGQPPPLRGPSPLLFVRFLGVPGMRVTFYRGDQGDPHELELPVRVGLRPGYTYRVKITGLPGRPDAALYPTLEVRGSLCLPPHTSAEDHPVPLVFPQAELERAQESVFITKVVYLENPDRAAPTATRPDQPLETTLPAGDDLLQAARELGRPMVVLRLGGRPVGEDELRRCAIPGTVLLPTERTLLPPRVPPCLPWAGVPLYDPYLGPRPATEECLHDGGDVGRKAGIAEDGRVGGLDPSDTVAEYTDAHGQRRLTCSNRICLCVPRFAVLRSELPLAGFENRVGPGEAQLGLKQRVVTTLLPSRQALKYEQLLALRGRERATSTVAEQAVGRLVMLEVLNAYEIVLGPAVLLGTARASELTEVQRLRLLRQMEFARSLSRREGPGEFTQQETTAVVGRVEGLKLVTATLETCDLTAICKEPPVLLGKPLHLYKWADRESAQVGDVVTFFLKYTNAGGQPISDVAVSDSLTGRLEYVPGSAKADRNAVFTMQQNEAGSLILRWEVSGTLLPCQSGVVSFQARIR